MSLDTTTGFFVFFLAWIALMMVVALAITSVFLVAYGIIDHFRRRNYRRMR